jgi:hypothetical protein
MGGTGLGLSIAKCLRKKSSPEAKGGGHNSPLRKSLAAPIVTDARHTDAHHFVIPTRERSEAGGICF